MATKTVSEITVNKIRIGGKAPKKIMKGSTEVKKVTKGSTVVYLKEDITYTLTGTGGTAGAAGTTITFSIKSYKGSSTAVAIASSNVSVTAGGGSVSSVTASGTTYTVKLSISSNSSTSSKTHTIKVTQPTSGQSITVSGTQSGSANYYKVSRTYIFLGTNWPSWGTNAYLNMPTFILGNVDVAEQFGVLNNEGTGAFTQGGDVIDYVSQMMPEPVIYTGSTFSMSLYISGTTAGSSAYHGTEFKFTVRCLSTPAIINSISSSWIWEMGVQPTPTVTLETTCNTISSTTTDNELRLEIDLTSG